MCIRDRAFIEGKSIRKVIVVPGKLVKMCIRDRLMPAQLPASIERPVENMLVRFVGPLSYNAIQSSNSLPDQEQQWQRLLSGAETLTIPANTEQQVLIDLGMYTCAYPELCVSGGAGTKLELRWAESLYDAAQGHAKGQRDAIEGKFFRGIGDSWLSDGGEQRRLDTLWWRCGRFVELSIRTHSEPLRIEHVTLYETGYPLEPDLQLSASDARLNRLAEIAIRSLHMCAHETYMDCPCLLYTSRCV